MDVNTTNGNMTVSQLIVDLVNLTVNGSDYNSSDGPVMDLYEEYRMREKSKILVYKTIGYIVGAAIILSNLSVVISSGLILRKGHRVRPKSTYMLLGNVSLADTVVGFSVVYGLSADETAASSTWCVFKMGMLVCPAMVSIFSVGLIAVDRYIYILHGLYYRRWFNTARVRVGIVLIWMIGIILGFMPATGWVNTELNSTRCYYVGLFPGPLVLLNSLLSIVPIMLVAVLYTFILVKALKTVKTIKGSVKVADTQPSTDAPKLRIHRGTVNIKSGEPTPKAKLQCTLKRSVSFDLGDGHKPKQTFMSRSKSIENIITESNRMPQYDFRRQSDISKQSKIDFESECSMCTVETTTSRKSLSIDSPNNKPAPQAVSAETKETKLSSRKVKEPNKWRAIKVVLLTSGSFIFTWMPFFITVIFFVFCEDKLTNPRCINIRAMLGGPLAILAFVNSILNPIIYAWWHKGFQKSVKAYYRQYCYKYIRFAIR